jgi:hypothetical protein
MTTQLRLTPEEAKEVHDECICTQGEIQKEIEEEVQVQHQQKEQGAHNMHPPLPEHITYDTMNHNDTPVTSSEHHRELNLQQEPDQNDTIGRLAHKLSVSRDTYMDWAEETERVLVQSEYLQPIYPTPTPAPPPPAP